MTREEREQAVLTKVREGHNPFSLYTERYVEGFTLTSIGDALRSLNARGLIRHDPDKGWIARDTGEKPVRWTKTTNQGWMKYTRDGYTITVSPAGCVTLYAPGCMSEHRNLDAAKRAVRRAQ